MSRYIPPTERRKEYQKKSKSMVTFQERSPDFCIYQVEPCEAVRHTK
jgi:hypothetical protein